MPGAPKIDLVAIRKRNAAVLKKLENGGKARYMYTLYGGKPLLVIGTPEPALETAMREGGAYSGTVEITKGTLSDPGQLKFTGVKANRRQLDDELKLFTKKKAVYV